MKKNMVKSGFIIYLIVAFLCLSFLPATGYNNSCVRASIEKVDVNTGRYPLPEPIPVDMVLEESICRRMSVRAFTGESITDEELSTILWAAYGYTDNGERTIFSPDGQYSTVIYVIRSDATYKYVPEDHSLSLFKNGNYLHLGQYTAPIKFGLVWDTNIVADEKEGMAQIGMIGQNIYFDANALDLGTVTTGMSVNDLYQLGIPANEKPEIIMPLGHPTSVSYDFTYNPLPESNLPPVINNTITLADAVNNRKIVNVWNDEPLSLVEQSQLIWSSYGHSYLWDNVNNKRHRTLPSAIDIYPFKIFAASQSGVYQYNPGSHSLSTIVQGDRREEINDSLESQNIVITSASWIIIAFLDTNMGSPTYQRFWYYEAGAITHNVLLEATALNLSSNVITGIADENGLRTALGIPSQTNLIPLSVIPVGVTPSSPNNPPDKPNLFGPTSGIPKTEYTYSSNTSDPDEDQIYYLFDWGDGTSSGWQGPFASGTLVEKTHSWADKGIYTIRSKAKDDFGGESDWSDPLILTITKNKAIYTPFFKFLWIHPNLIILFKILQKL